MKKIELIKKAVALGIIEKTIHPFTKQELIIQDNDDVTYKWEELEKFVNSQRNVKINIGIKKEDLGK